MGESQIYRKIVIDFNNVFFIIDQLRIIIFCNIISVETTR